MIWELNSILDLIRIAAFTLEGEILAREQNYDAAFTKFASAVAIEDVLNYNEPPDWFFSVRHTWGHWLVKANRFSDAEKIYLQDLETFPETGWALIGLYNSLKGQNKTAEAAEVYKRFEKAWQWADLKIESSRVE